jgi:hypothetical protein
MGLRPRDVIGAGVLTLVLVGLVALLFASSIHS